MNVLCRAAAASARSLPKASRLSATVRLSPVAFFSSTTRRPESDQGTTPPQSIFQNSFSKSDPFQDQPIDKITVGNLPYETTDAELKDAFGRFGAIRTLRTWTAPDGYRSAWITYEKPAAAAEAISGSHRKFFQGRQLKVKLAQVLPRNNKDYFDGPETEEPSSTLFIHNLPVDVTDAQLAELFDGVDGVKFARMAMDKRTGEFLGRGWIDFRSVEHAVAAKEKLNGRAVRNFELRVKFNRDRKQWVPREDWRQRVKAQTAEAKAETEAEAEAETEAQLAPQPDTDEAALPIERDAKLDIEPPAPEAVEGSGADGGLPKGN